MLQLLEPLDIRGLQAFVLGLPLVVGGRADAVRPPDLLDQPPGIGLLKMPTICVSVNFDCRMGTFWLGVASVP
jgi:hypothetical protein